jgi:GNAT superfamily N-acetyltransferase
MYKLQKSDLTKASITLRNAFINYPIFEYIIPDTTYRNKKLRYVFRFLLGLGIINGEVIAPSNRLEGVSIWLPSTRSHSSNTDAVRAGLLNLLFHLDSGSIDRLIEIGKSKSLKRREILKGSYYFCDMIGVEPQIQRQGVGRKMIEAKLRDFDGENVPCYLETSNLENVDYYKQYGFALYHHYKITDIDVFCLLRKANAGKEK